MNTLLDQLIALTGRLMLAAGVPDSMLAELHRCLAAILIQQNPKFLPVIPNLVTLPLESVSHNRA